MSTSPTPTPTRHLRPRAPSPATPLSVLPGPAIDVAETLAGKNILLIGTTGFVGKVALSMLLTKYPDVGRVYCLVRPGAGNTADERFYRKVATSEAFDPLRELHGDGYEAFLRRKIVAMPGDIGNALCGFTEDDFARFVADGGLHVVVNSAGLVSFMPSLESALRINALGAQNVLETAKRAGARLVHVSTCYVAGMRHGDVWEDEPIVGYFPRRDELKDTDFSPQAECADCQRIIDQTRERANDRAHISLFRERAAKTLKEQRRDPDDDGALRLGVARERKLWMNQELTRLGMERAQHWGWTNTYTYTKSLGEQLILADDQVISTVVRPAIVESAVSFPFPGWNEGFNTTAPLVYLMRKGHRSIPAGENTALDVIPVDYITAGMWLATAAVLRGVHKPVYQLGTSDSNRVTSRRVTELTALAVRGEQRGKAAAGEDEFSNRVKARLEGLAVSYDHFNRFSAPMIRRAADASSAWIDSNLPRWGAPRLEALAERAQEELAGISRFTGQVIDLVELFKPFNYDRDIAFRCDNIRELWRSVTPYDQDALSWEPERIDWREYWIGVHYQGLKTWTFKTLDEEFGAKPRSVYTHRDLVELFDATVKLNKQRVALRFRYAKEHGDAEPDVYRYERVGELVGNVTGWLMERGVAPGDRVMLMSENRPEWPMAYFGILKTSGVAVPLDSQLSLAEVVNVGAASGARVFLLSPRQAMRLLDDAGIAYADGEPFAVLRARLPAHDVVDLGEPLSGTPPAAWPNVRGDQVASLIFTSGTTGQPKGVMLTHKNLTAMVSRLASVFSLFSRDGLLSVLPLHHTLEFSAGLLMPMLHGSSITYLEEINADELADALASGSITGMVGVPALWQLLERKVFAPVREQGPLLLRALENAVEFHYKLGDWAPWGGALGKVAFFPVHRKFGGRLRLLISGGSALGPDTMKIFRGLGFDLYEGYGMTESSPVLTVTRPGDKLIPGSVGRALPGLDVRIDAPDHNGIGEVIAKGPNVMQGYYNNEAATAQTLADGWLHTGDLGRLDADGNLFIVGRKKELILGPQGENIYPDELEELYATSEFIKELSVVGVPAGDNEIVGALVVPDYSKLAPGQEREALREAVRSHLKEISKTLAPYKRLKIVHLWEHDLPRTSTRKVKRREVVAELVRLERAASEGAQLATDAANARVESGGHWVRDIVANVAQKPRTSVIATTRLADLGFDSLMLTELGVALEAAGVALPDPSELLAIEVISDLETWVARQAAKGAAAKRTIAATSDAESRGVWGGGERTPQAQADDIDVPASVVRAGRAILRRGQRALYDNVLHTKLHGKIHVPPFGGYIVAANHSSHLDMGLCKYALGEQGDALVALAAKDYFFDDPVRRMYFENFTNLVPMERHGSLRESLAVASDVIRNGYILLIFPEGTRSETGEMIDFKPSLGYLAMQNKCGILPMFLDGTHRALPRGAYLPKHRDVAAHIGPFMDYAQAAAIASGKSKATGYRAITTHVEGIVRGLVPQGSAWMLGPSGRAPAATADKPGEST
ncbi:MAG: AMP-binding protein [Myxococcales bacterium]|nr:AMP-binding protein [Myxococcales bacterium]